MEFSVSCRVGVIPVWEELLCDDTSARTIIAISSIIRLTIVIIISMMVVVIIIIIIVIKVMFLIMTRKLKF